MLRLRLLPLLCAAALLGLGACAPRLSPLYRDYEAARADSAVEARIQAALVDAGWTLRPQAVPNLVATEERKFSDWGLYQIRAALEVAQVGDRHVRVFVHPYRRYVTGGRSKIPFLKDHLHRQLLGDLSKSFARHGIHVVGTPFEKDRVALIQ